MNLWNWFRENVLEKARQSNIGWWMWLALASFVALQIYYVREMLAALIIFGILFAAGAFVVLVLFLLDRASQRTAAWTESQAKRAAQTARRGLLQVEELSKKLPHRTIAAK